MCEKKDEMRAWVVTEAKKLELKTIPIPVPRDDEVLIKISASCLCNGSDPGIYNGHESYTPPFVFGHEAAGVIVETGKDMKKFSIGDVVFCWCAMGAFAQYQTMSQTDTALFKVPNNVTQEQGPILELVIASCRALMSRPAEKNRETITICGLGPSGLVLLQYARLLGYKKIIGWDLYESRRRLALELGADMVFNPAELSVDSISSMPMADICVDMMGDDKLPSQPTLTLLMRATRVGGTVISYGHPENGRMFSPFVFQSRSLQMVSPMGDLEKIRLYGNEVLNFVKDGKIQIEPLITHRKNFEDIGEAFSHLLEKPQEQIKVVFRMEDKI